MKQIISPSGFFSQVVGLQDINDSMEYRKNKMLVIDKVDEGYLLYNTLLGSMYLLSNDEFSCFDKCFITNEMRDLIRDWFFVPVDYDEFKTYCDFKQIAQVFLSGNYIRTYTIMPTTDCNARCPYCYEHGIARVHMNDVVVDKLVEFIKSNNGGGNIRLRWFGGEPLYNVCAINKICEKLVEQGIDFSSSMISNAYLFTDEMIGQAKKSWNLKDVQITLDGTAEQYNKIKAYIYKEDFNPFERVIANIKKLIKNKIHVKIRLNAGFSNIEDLFDLVEFLNKEIGRNRYLTIYTVVLYGLLENASGEEVDIFKSRLRKLKELIYKYSLYNICVDDKGFSYNNCMADDLHSVMIDPEGNLLKCEHHCTEDIFGNIFDGDFDQDKIKVWKKERYFDKCKDCAFLTKCNKLEKCPTNTSSCQEFDYLLLEDETKYQMHNSFLVFKNCN